MARTRAAGDNGANRDAPAPRAAPRAPRAGTSRGGPRPTGSPQPTGSGQSRHAFGIFAVVAVFALVGVTLWRPLAALAALPVIIVLALVVRSAVPVPAPARSRGGGTRSRQARETPARDARPRPTRYEDRSPYDQAADRPVRPAGQRRRTQTPPPPPERFRPSSRDEPDDATEVYRTDEPGQPGYRRPAGRPGDARRPGYPPDAGWDPSAARRAGAPGDEAALRGRRDSDPRRPAAAAGQDRGAAAPQYPVDPASQGRGMGEGYADDYYADGRRQDRRAGGARADRPGEPAWRGDPAGGYRADYPARHGYDAGGSDPDGYDREGYDDYPDSERAAGEPGTPSQAGHGPGEPSGDRRRRGWRHQVWDDEGWDDTPEPEPDEDMMHTMSIDMRGYLDDTGSFRMP